MHRWASATWTEIRDIAGKALLVVGAIEQHGPHLPLSTDVLIPERLAQAATEGTDVALIPTLPFGARSHPRTGGGARFPGGLFLDDSVLTNAIENLVSDAVASGAENVYVLSWHYENSAPLWQGCRAAHLSTGARVTLIDSPGDLMDPALISTDYPGEFPGWAAEHAAVVETSLMLYLAPELVRTSAIPVDKPELPKPWDLFPEESMTIPDNGVFAPAHASSSEFGQRLFDSMTEGLSRLIQGKSDR